VEPFGVLVTAALFLGAEIVKKSADDVATVAWTRIRAAFKQAFGHDPSPEEIDQASLEKVIGASEDVQADLEHVAGHSSALRRASLAASALVGAKILWIDDQPAGNAWERQMLVKFGVSFVTVETTNSAIACLKAESFHLVLSDIARGDEPKAGLEALPAILEAAPAIPVVFYVGHVLPNRPVPVDSKGIAAEPNELLHLVLDQLERTRL